MNKISQTQLIKDRLNYYLDAGLVVKMDIYTKVIDDLGVPRPTVRRVARDLRTELLNKIQILQSDVIKVKEDSMVVEH